MVRLWCESSPMLCQFTPHSPKLCFSFTAFQDLKRSHSAPWRCIDRGPCRTSGVARDAWLTAEWCDNVIRSAGGSPASTFGSHVRTCTHSRLRSTRSHCLYHCSNAPAAVTPSILIWFQQRVWCRQLSKKSPFLYPAGCSTELVATRRTLSAHRSMVDSSASVLHSCHLSCQESAADTVANTGACPPSSPTLPCVKAQCEHAYTTERRGGGTQTHASGEIHSHWALGLLWSRRVRVRVGVRAKARVRVRDSWSRRREPEPRWSDVEPNVVTDDSPRQTWNLST